MIALEVNLDNDGEAVWPDLKDRAVIEGDFAAITGLRDGTTSGQPTVMIRIELSEPVATRDAEEASVIVAQTTLALFLIAADALKARYGDPRLA